MSLKLVLSRKSEWVNRLRSYTILIDGKPAGTIAADEKKEFELLAGSHTLECKIDWYLSNRYEINCTNGDNLNLQVKSSMVAYRLMFVIFIIYMLAINLFSSIWKSFGETGEWIRRGLYLLPITYLAYYITVGRRQYLKIERETSNGSAI